MRDVTKEFFKQPKDYGKRANLNITRVDIYASKIQNIYRILGNETLLLRIRFGNTITRQFPADQKRAVETLREYGELYFLDVTYANTGDYVTIHLKGLLPQALKKLHQKKAE